VLLGAVWGSSFMFMRVAAPELGAFALVEIRLALGAAVLMPFLWRDRARMRADAWPTIGGIALLTASLPFLLFAWASQRAPAGVVAITNSMQALFTALFAALLWREAIGRQRAMGLIAGFVGAAVLAGGKAAGASFGWAAAAGTFASALYAVGGIVLKRRLGDLPPNALAAATLGVGALAVLPVAVAHWPTHAVPARAWAAAAVLGIVCTGLANSVYFRLVQRIGAVRSSVVTYLVPLFGIAWAWIWLDEPLSLQAAVAAALILASVALVQRAR
jgi:drug/metabolite transporter (DMT)-like permease